MLPSDVAGAEQPAARLSLSKPSGRTLVVGDPVVGLGNDVLIRDGALLVEGDTIVASGSRVELESLGPFDEVLGSSRHFIMPGFVNCHYHSELAIGPGLYQYVFERANVFIQGAVGPIEEDDLYTGILWGPMTALKEAKRRPSTCSTACPAWPTSDVRPHCKRTKTAACVRRSAL